MSIFRDVIITYKGKDHAVTPTLRLLRLIEAKGVSLTDIAHRTQLGQAPVSHVALVLSMMLQSAGVNASEDDLYSTIMTGDEKQATSLIRVVLEAFSPEVEGGEKKPADRPSGRTKRPTRQKAG